MKIAVIILTLNQCDRTLQCLDNLLATQESEFEVVLWDNGSQDGTAEAVREALPQVLVHRSPANLGVASGRNAAAELAIQSLSPTHLLFLDNDMLVEPGFVSALFEPFAEYADLGQTQAKLRFMHDRLRLNDGGGAKINFVLWQTTPVGFGELDHGQYDTARPCVSCGGAMMVSTDVFKQLNGFDPIFDPFGPEDLDFSLRLQKAGYRALYVPRAVAYHAVSHTFGEGYHKEYARHKSRHWFTFMRRHASLAHQLGFFLYGIPFLSVRVVLREGRKGNFAAIWGLARGVLDYSNSATGTEKKEWRI